LKSTSYLMIFLLFVVGTSGCCVLGKNVDDQKFDASALDRLTANQTPAAEICEIFGAPCLYLSTFCFQGNSGLANIGEHGYVRQTI